MAVLVELPAALRGAMKEPLGPVYTDPAELLADVTEPVVAVGDIVTYHLLGADYRPAVAVVDGRSERDRIDGAVGAVLDIPVGAEREGDRWFDDDIEVENPPATLTTDLVAGLRAALGESGSTLVVVDGEEDLATLPAILAVPEGASVVYGQPNEGMVLVVADAASRQRVRELLGRMDGDHDALWRVLGVADGD